MGKSSQVFYSFSRAKSLAECPRAGFFEYWAKREEPESRRVWALKDLTIPVMAAGTEVDHIVSRSLERARNGKPINGLAPIGIKSFRKAVADSPAVCEILRQRSLSQEERAATHHRPLINDYYGGETTPEEIANLEARIERCLTNIEESGLIERLATIAEGQIGDYPHRRSTAASFTLPNGITAYAAFDIYWIEGDILYIIDWKSGNKNESSEANAHRQLMVYALYGHIALGFPIEKIFVQAVWLNEPVIHDLQPVTKASLDFIADLIESEHMEELQKVEAKTFPSGRVEYVADRANFPPKPSLHCRQCKFRELCPEGQALVRV